MGRKFKKPKLSKTDFDTALLPKSRKEQFKDIFSHEFKTFLWIGLIFLLFAVPYFAAMYCNNILMYTLIEENAASIASDEISTYKFTFSLIFNGLTSLSYLLFAIPLAGSLRIVKNLVYGEPILFKDDFFAGIKKYWKITLIVCALLGVFKFITETSINYCNIFLSSTGLNFMSGLLLGIFYLIIIPTLFFLISLYITYDLKPKQIINLSFRFQISNLIFSVLMGGSFLLSYVIKLIPSFLVVLLLFAIIFVLIIPFYILVWHLYVTSRFDKFINEKSFPEIFRKGISN